MFLPEFLVLLCQAISTFPIKKRETKKQGKKSTQRKKKREKNQRSDKIKGRNIGMRGQQGVLLPDIVMD